MSAIAIDVAFLLPPDARAVTERVNAHFDTTAVAGFRFDATHHPHLTLGQHFVERDRLVDVCTAVATLLSATRPINLRVTGARGGRTAQVLAVDPAPMLRRLHERVMDTLAAYEVAGDAAGFFGDDEPPRDGDVAWVRRFRAESSHARFDPHITVGIGQTPVDCAPFTFVAGEIAVCHLGRFCTCRDRLARWALPASPVEQ
jgi:2'-5' RNA ligase